MANTRFTAVGVANAIANCLQAQGDDEYARQQLQKISNILLDAVMDKQTELDESMLGHYGDNREVTQLDFVDHLGDLLGDKAIELDPTFYADEQPADL